MGSASKIWGELNKARSGKLLLRVLSSKGVTEADSADQSSRSKKRLVIFHVTYEKGFLRL